MTSGTGGATATESQAARLYLSAVICAGAAATLHSAFALSRIDQASWAVFGLLAFVTFLSGTLTLHVPGLPARISVSEMFIFACVVLLGPAAGTVTIAFDAAVMSWRTGRNLQRALFNSAALALSLWIAGHVFVLAGGRNPLPADPLTGISTLALPLLLLAIVSFLVNSALVAIAVSFDTGVAPHVLWRRHFLWLSLNSLAGASIALLVLATTRQFSVGAVAVVAPLVIISYLTFRSSLGRMEDAEAHVARVDRLYLSTIETLATAIDAKDEVTHGHIRRVQALTLQLARTLDITDEATLKAIEAAALLHDTGKLAVPEHILNKPGKLTPAEFERMKLHASVGADILANVDFPYPVVPIVRHHHENWDGTGYPAGLHGTDIPIGARILSVVDCFDALTSDRPYRRKLTNEAAIAILLERRGTMYDPQVVDTFISLERRNGLVETAPAVSPVIDARAAQVPVATHAAHAGQPVDEQGDELLPLRTLASVLPNDTRGSDVLVLLAAHLRAMFPITTAAVYAIDREHDDVVLQYAWGRGAEALVGHRLPSGAGLSGWVAVNRQTIVNSEAGLDLGPQVAIATPPLACCLSVPLIDDEKLVGVLSLYSSAPDAFTAQHGRLSQLAAPLVAKLMGRHLAAAPAPAVWTGTEPGVRTTVH